MNTLQTTAARSNAADLGGAARSPARAGTAGDTVGPAMSEPEASAGISLALPAYGVRATFSPRSLEVLEQAAQALGGGAQQLGNSLSEAGSELVASVGATAQAAVDQVGEVITAVADGAAAGAQVLAEGADAVQGSLQSALRSADETVKQSAQQLADIAGEVLSYGALAGLAANALLSETV